MSDRSSSAISCGFSRTGPRPALGSAIGSSTSPGGSPWLLARTRQRYRWRFVLRAPRRCVASAASAPRPAPRSARGGMGRPAARGARCSLTEIGTLEFQHGILSTVDVEHIGEMVATSTARCPPFRGAIPPQEAHRDRHLPLRRPSPRGDRRCHRRRRRAARSSSPSWGPPRSPCSTSSSRAVRTTQFIRTDLADPAQIDAAVAQIDGPVAALFNNAGVADTMPRGHRLRRQPASPPGG